MRKVILAVFALALMVAGCSSIDCSVYNTVAGRYRFMNQDGDSVKYGGYITVTSTRTIDGNDTVLVNKKANACTLQIPVSYALDTDELYISFLDSAYTEIARDKISITKTNEPVFESVDCAPRYNHTVSAAACTHNIIDSIVVNNNKIDNDLTKVHFYLYISTSD